MNESPNTTLKFRMWIMPVLLVITLVLEILFPYPGWLMILLGLGLTWAFSYTSIRFLSRHLIITREMRYGWMKVGDVFEERIRVENTGPMGTAWLEIIDHTNIPGHKRAIGTNVDAHANTVWHSKHHCTRRGLYRLGPTTLKTQDLFGFYALSLHDPTTTNILITPPVVPLPQIEVAGGGQTGDGRISSGLLEPSIAVKTVRDFQPADPLHHIHWPTTAKRGKLTTRVFDSTPTGSWWVIQDMNQAVQAGKGNQSTLETGIILAASIANKGIEANKPVGFVANNLQKTWIPPARRNDQHMTILKALAISEPGTFSLNHLLKTLKASFHQHASLVIITPDLSLAWWEPLITLKARGVIPTILLLDRQSFGGSGSTSSLMNNLKNAGITSYTIDASLLSQHMDVKEAALWEWRVFGTGQAVPIKKPKESSWKRL